MKYKIEIDIPDKYCVTEIANKLNSNTEYTRHCPFVKFGNHAYCRKFLRENGNMPLLGWDNRQREDSFSCQGRGELDLGTTTTYISYIREYKRCSECRKTFK